MIEAELYFFFNVIYDQTVIQKDYVYCPNTNAVYISKQS